MVSTMTLRNRRVPVILGPEAQSRRSQDYMIVERGIWLCCLSSCLYSGVEIGSGRRVVFHDFGSLGQNFWIWLQLCCLYAAFMSRGIGFNVAIKTFRRRVFSQSVTCTDTDDQSQQHEKTCNSKIKEKQFVLVKTHSKTSCAGGRHNMPRPLSVDL